MAANPVLRAAYGKLCKKMQVRLVMPPLSACGDNAGMIALVALDQWLYRAHGLALPLASALLLTALVYAGISGWGTVLEGARRRELARLFGTYVPPELVAQMARDPQRYGMQAENRVLTILFCDMRNFTRVSEALPPEELRALINRFFSAMTEEIRAHRGTLDKYIGDAIMAFWGAPLADGEHARHALEAAMEMIVKLDDINAQNLKMQQGEKTPEDVQRHASEWIAAHQQQWDAWLAASRKAAS